MGVKGKGQKEERSVTERRWIYCIVLPVISVIFHIFASIQSYLNFQYFTIKFVFRYYVFLFLLTFTFVLVL